MRGRWQWFWEYAKRLVGSRRRAAVLAGLILAYLALMFPLGCGRMLADRFLLFPSRDPVRTMGALERFVETPVGRVHVLTACSQPSVARPAAQTAADLWASRARQAASQPPPRFVVRFEGNGGRAEYTAVYVAERWDEQPTEVWAMNHPGYGKSQGPASLNKLAPAALAVYDAACAEAGDRPVFLDADSMGCTMALYVAAVRADTRPPAGLVLKNPPPLRQIVLGRFGWWNLWLAAGPIAAGIPVELDALRNARRVRAPAVFICATADTLVPFAYQQKIIDAYAGRTSVLAFRDAEHNTPLDEPIEGEIRDALRDLAGAGSSTQPGDNGPGSDIAVHSSGIAASRLP